MAQPYWNPADKDGDVTLSNSNRTCAIPNTGTGSVRTTTAIKNSDGWYVELSAVQNSGNTAWRFGVATAAHSIAGVPGDTSTSWVVRGSDGQLRTNGSNIGASGIGSPSAILMIAVKNGSVWFGENGTWQGDPAAGTGAAFSGLTGDLYLIFGHAATTGNTRGCTFAEVGSYTYSPPSGFSEGWVPDTEQHAIEADVSAAATVSAGLTAVRQVTADVSAAATVSGTFGLTKTIQAAVAAAVTVEGTARRNAVLGAGVSAAATVEATLRHPPTILHLQNDAADLTGYKDASTTINAHSTTSYWQTTLPRNFIWKYTQITDTSGGTALQWVSGYVSEAVTLNGTFTFQVRGNQEAYDTNAYWKAKIWKRSRAGVETLIGGDESVTPGDDFTDDTEISTGSSTLRTWAGTLPDDVEFEVDDRLVIRLYLIHNIGSPSAYVRAYYDFDSTIQSVLVTLPDRVSFTTTANQPAVDIEAAVSVSATVSAPLELVHGLFGDLSVAGTAAGDLIALHTLQGALSGSASVQGALDFTAGLSGALAAAGTTSADLRLNLTLAGALTGTSAVSADLTRIEGSMEGDLSVAVSLAGDAKITRGLSAAPDATGTLSGVLNVLHNLAAGVTVVATANATILSYEEFQANADVVVTATGLLGIPYGISADLSAGATVSGAIIRVAMPEGLVSASASVSASIGVIRGLSGSVEGVATTAGVMIRVMGLSGDLEVIAEATANTSTSQSMNAGIVIEVFGYGKLTRPVRYYNVSRPAPIVMRS